MTTLAQTTLRKPPILPHQARTVATSLSARITNHALSPGVPVFDTADIDALMAAIAGGNNPLGYDLTNDALVNKRDLDVWRELAGAANLGPGRQYLPGDSNLDGLVNEADFDIWNANKFTASAGSQRKPGVHAMPGIGVDRDKPSGVNDSLRFKKRLQVMDAVFGPTNP